MSVDIFVRYSSFFEILENSRRESNPPPSRNSCEMAERSQTAISSGSYIRHIYYFISESQNVFSILRS